MDLENPTSSLGFGQDKDTNHELEDRGGPYSVVIAPDGTLSVGVDMDRLKKEQELKEAAEEERRMQARRESENWWGSAWDDPAVPSWTTNPYVGDAYGEENVSHEALLKIRLTSFYIFVALDLIVGIGGGWGIDSFMLCLLVIFVDFVGVAGAFYQDDKLLRLFLTLSIMALVSTMLLVGLSMFVFIFFRVCLLYTGLSLRHHLYTERMNRNEDTEDRDEVLSSSSSE